MKKIFITILAVAALAACTKSEVAYDAPAEIGFAPVKGNLTKASGLSGSLATTQELGVWAYWDNDGTVGTEVTDANATNFSNDYLVNALFEHESGTSWGAPEGKSYPWPVNGSLIFAGYTAPADKAVLSLYSSSQPTAANTVSYDRDTDVMTFHNYTNTNEFDLCWFGRTNKSYNNRADGTSVPVDLSHALTWVTIAAYGQNSAIGWKITSMTLNNYNVAGTATCDGDTKKATWNSFTENASPLTIGTDKLPHTLAAATDGKGVELSDNVLIPSDDVELTVNFSFDVNGVTKTDSKTFTLNTDPWVSGVHYTYTLVFNSTEILLAPKYEEWGLSDDNTITVE